MHTRAIISAILQKIENNETKVYVQTRWKPHTSPTYSGLIEIPAGGIDPYENVYDALSREVQEECGLRIVKVINDYRSEILEPRPNDKAFVFKPFLCQQVLETNNGLPWIGFVFLCEVEGKVKIQKEEAKDPNWLTLVELEEILINNPETIFPLQLPVLKYYVEYMKNK
jgi:8-oxo-dGTP diphosphatase